MNEHSNITTSSRQTGPAAIACNVSEPVVQEFVHEPAIQCSLTVGAPNDPLEDEADTMADTVMRMPENLSGSFSGNSFLQRKCAHCEEEEKAQRKPLSTSISSFIQTKSSGEATTSASLSNKINSSRGNGTLMDGSTKTFMESRFGSDFSSVNIHTGSESVMMNRELNAKAFTVGNDIYFNEGQYNPTSDSGKHLLAHELTHTIQQGKAVNRKIQRVQQIIGPLTHPPANWAADVAAATTSAQKTALIQRVVGTSLTITDVTAASSGDRFPTAAHLQPITSASRVINFDEGLQSKRSPVDRRLLNINAGYTLHSGGSNYVILSNAALDASDYYQIILTLNHEFDHLNQQYSGSTLTGDASELDAWTTTFIREFEHSYTIRENVGTTTCYVDRVPLYAPLSMYYQQLSGNTTARSGATGRIQSFYTSRLRSIPELNQVFLLWIYNSMRSTHNPALGTDLNTALSLGVNTTAGRRTYSQFVCDAAALGRINSATAPALSLPNFPAAAAPKSPKTP